MKNAVLRLFALILIVSSVAFAVSCTPKSDKGDKNNTDGSSDNGSNDNGTDSGNENNGSTDGSGDFNGGGFVGEWDTEM